VDWSLDVPMAPEAAAARIARAINLPKKRLFGVLKTRSEFVGVVEGTAFEIWERQSRAVHAVGQISGVRGGSRVEARFVVNPRTRVLGAAFFVLYAIAAFGIAEQGALGLSPTSLAIAIAGFLLLVAIFYAGARAQRAQLARFLSAVFAETV
jgi:hypothetical protein